MIDEYILSDVVLEMTNASSTSTQTGCSTSGACIGVSLVLQLIVWVRRRTIHLQLDTQLNPRATCRESDSRHLFVPLRADEFRSWHAVVDYSWSTEKIPRFRRTGQQKTASPT